VVIALTFYLGGLGLIPVVNIFDTLKVMKKGESAILVPNMRSFQDA